GGGGGGERGEGQLPLQGRQGGESPPHHVRPPQAQGGVRLLRHSGARSNSGLPEFGTLRMAQRMAQVGNSRLGREPGIQRLGREIPGSRPLASPRNDRQQLPNPYFNFAIALSTTSRVYGF